jgi:6-pyruvoyltetrahydropterin/6-carboxytetrahydropterin synthase
MPIAHLTRRVMFSAAHRYRLPQWSEERNLQVFGKCAHENYHGHRYTCDVTVAGQIDPMTGFVVDLGRLDRILNEEVHQRFDHKNINLDVPEFEEGRKIPSSENLAKFIFERVEDALGELGTVVKVRIGEDDDLSATYRGGT